jgi:DNA-binding transcriptional LysR family regulator
VGRRRSPGAGSSLILRWPTSPSQPYILLTVDEGEESNRRYWTDNGLSPNIAFRTNGMEALRGLVAHGFGVTILSDMVYRPWSLEGKKIEARPILDAIPHLEVGLIWATRRGRSPSRPKPCGSF